MHVIFGNYGNQTIAVIQWVLENKLQDVYVVSIDTKWHAQGWNKHVSKAENWLKALRLKTVRLESKPSFVELMLDRKQFPSTKFQWCAGFLKGIAFLDWLDEQDPAQESIIILGKRRADSKANFALEEFILESEHYGDRKVWHPLYKHSDEQFKTLIHKTPMPFLNHRALECQPCVNSYGNDLANIQDKDIIKTKHLEDKVGTSMFELPIEDAVNNARKTNETIANMFDMGCGSTFACGE